MGKYNGHHCWNCWNVAVWIGNDEGLYHTALECIRHTKNRDQAARLFLLTYGESSTPDGARYTFKGVRNALVGLT
jgi:hypothetical protein